MTVTIAIVGRPNVGKSTLFNRLVGRRAAIVDDTPGVTRDRREGDAKLGDLRFRIVDTAGFETSHGGDLASRVQAQTVRALSCAEAALFVIDARAGVTPIDRELAALLRRSGRPILFVANKCEGRAAESGLGEAHILGLGPAIPLSAEHGEGLAMLYDALQPLIDGAAARDEAAAGDDTAAMTGTGDDAVPGAEVEADHGPLQLAVVGRPNVGKSTLINRLVGDERLVTGPEAGITRDAIAVDWTFRGKTLRMFDTAGLRRRARIDDRLEHLAGIDTQRAIRFAHVVVILVDATVGLDKQDLSIAELVVEEGRAPVLAVNKWDMIPDRGRVTGSITRRLEDSLPQARGLRPVFLSAATGEGLGSLLPAVLAAYELWNRKLGTPRLNRWLADMTEKHAPPSAHGRPVKLRYMTQTKARPPTFLLFSNRPEELPEAYLRYLANGLRESFGLAGIPLRLTVRRTRNPYVGDPS